MDRPATPIHGGGVGEIVNLNKARKAKARADAARAAAANRAAHGRTRAEKAVEAAAVARREALLDGTRMDCGDAAYPADLAP